MMTKYKVGEYFRRCCRCGCESVSLIKIIGVDIQDAYVHYQLLINGEIQPDWTTEEALEIHFSSPSVGYVGWETHKLNRLEAVVLFGEYYGD